MSKRQTAAALVLDETESERTAAAVGSRLAFPIGGWSVIQRGYSPQCAHTGHCHSRVGREERKQLSAVDCASRSTLLLVSGNSGAISALRCNLIVSVGTACFDAGLIN